MTGPDHFVKPWACSTGSEGTSTKIAGANACAPSERTQVPRWLQHVFENADRLVFAVDSAQVDPAAFLLPAHQSLTVLSFFDAVSALWRQLQIPGHPARFKPWMVSSRLRTHLARLPAPGAEPLLLAEAKRRPAPPHFLETPPQWVASFDAVPLEEQLEELERVVTSPDEAASFEVAVHEAWTTHNLKTMGELLESQRQRQPSFARHSLDGRNQRWLPGMVGLLDDEAKAKRMSNTLIVVEARHLCGPQGMVALLSSKGRTLTQLL